MSFNIIRSDLITIKADAIVNPTNSDLYGTAGVDGRIHEIEGPRLRKETNKYRNLEPGQCVMTKAYKLPASNIIHTVGPVWKDGLADEQKVLKKCYENALALGKENAFESMAFPLIASGAFGVPKDIALKVAVEAIGEFLLFNEMAITLVVYDPKSFRISESLYASVETYIDDNYIEEHRVRNNGSRDNVSRVYRPRESDIIQPLKHRYNAYPLEEDSIQEASMEDVSLYDIKEVSAKLEKPKKEPSPKKRRSLDDLMNQLDESFSDMLFRLIDEKNLKDPEVYKKANVTKQTFSKIRNNRHYNPSKETAIALAIALELNMDMTKDLLLKAGYALSKSNKFDLIISFCIDSHNYNIMEINEILFTFEQKLLGI